MSQRLKYLNEENMEEIIASYTYHATMNSLKKSNCNIEPRKYPKTDEAGKEAVRSWLKWTYGSIQTEEFFEVLIELEDVMGEEKLLGTKVHEVLETVMLIQETNEHPEDLKEKMYHELEDMMEEEKLLSTKVHEVLEAVMLIQEVKENPEEQKKEYIKKWKKSRK
jgi:hypothetical protein